MDIASKLDGSFELVISGLEIKIHSIFERSLLHGYIGKLIDYAIRRESDQCSRFLKEMKR